MPDTHESFARDQHTKVSSNRTFGYVLSAALLLIAIRPLAFGGAPHWRSLIVSAVVLAVTLAVPALLTLPNRLWARIGILLNRVTSPVVLAILFYVVVTPMGLLMRAFGKDPLRLRHNALGDSYWIRRDPPGPKPESMSHQF
jgi:hypothetical protein